MLFHAGVFASPGIRAGVFTSPGIRARASLPRNRTSPTIRCPWTATAAASRDVQSPPCAIRSGKVTFPFRVNTPGLIFFCVQRNNQDPNSGLQYPLYPDPTPHNLAPVTPTSGQPLHSSSPHSYAPPPTYDRRSPPSAYAYDARHSSSPHGSPYPTQLAPMTPHQVPPVQGIQSGPTAQSSTPPPTSTPSGSQRAGLNVRDMLNPGNPGDPQGGGRSSTDSDMLNALNRRGPQ